MELRTATLDDVGHLVPLFDAYRQFYGRPSDYGLAERFLRDRLTAGESVIYIAAGPVELLGFVQLYPSFWSVAGCRTWILNDLYVAPGHRGSGVGRALMDRARAHAEQTGAGGLDLFTQKSNRTAQGLYEAAGWKREDEFFHYELSLPPRMPAPGAP
jgi:ribosomal protein S18 acetylase RimI-like enzyme